VPPVDTVIPPAPPIDTDTVVPPVTPPDTDTPPVNPPVNPDPDPDTPPNPPTAVVPILRPDDSRIDVFDLRGIKIFSGREQDFRPPLRPTPLIFRRPNEPPTLRIPPPQ
jgi:hypothetical protein